MNPRPLHRPTAVTALALTLALLLAGASCPARDDSPTLEVDTRLPMGPILLGGFSLVLVATGAGFGWQASQEYDDWKDARRDPAYATDPGAGQANVDELADDVRTHSITANVLMFSGAALAAVSILWWVLRDDPDDRPAKETAWRAGFGPGGASLELSF